MENKIAKNRISPKNENDYKEFKLSDLLSHSFNKDSM